MLAIFASHALKAGEGRVVAVSRGEPAFAEQIVPSYVRCLIDVRLFVALKLIRVTDITI